MSMKKRASVRKWAARFALLALVMTFVMSFSITAFADNNVMTWNSFTKGMSADDLATANKNVESGGIDKSDLNPAKQYVQRGTKYYEFNNASIGLSKAVEFSGNSISEDSVVDSIAEMNDTLDPADGMTGVANIISGFEPVLNTIIMVIAWLIVIGLPLVTALDVAYITIPFFREKAETARSNGNPGMTKQGKNGETKLRWISDEAQHAVETIDLDNGRSPLKTYLMSRILAFILVAIILYLLIGGQITVITQVAVRLVSGIVNFIGGLA